MISRTEWGSLIGLIKQSVHLHLLEILDDGLGRLLEWDSANLSTPSQVNRRTHAGQPLVPGGATALSSALQMVEKFADDCWRQVLYSHSINGAASLLACERKQEHQRIAIAGLRVARKVSLGHQMFEEEAANPGTKQVLILHGHPPWHIVRSVDLLPGGGRGSSADSVASIEHRRGQGRWRVAEATAERPDLSDTMPPPDARPRCGEDHAGAGAGVRQWGKGYLQLGEHPETTR